MPWFTPGQMEFQQDTVYLKEHIHFIHQTFSTASALTSASARDLADQIKI